MALPNSLDSTVPAGSASPSLGDDQFRAKTLALLDILGIPDATSITQAAFDLDAGGLAQCIFYDAAATPASGELGRSGSTLYYRITDARTNTVTRALGIIADTTGTPAASIGVGLLFQAESADEAPSDFGALDFVASDIGAGTEDTYFSVLLRVAGGALDEKYRFSSTAGSGFAALFTHAVTADRTYTLPDADAAFVGAASQAEMEAASSTTVAATPGRAQYHPGVAKAWGMIGAGPVVTVGYNVASVSDQVEAWRVTLTVGFSSSSYVVVVTQLADAELILNVSIISGTVFDVHARTRAAGTSVDPNTFMFAAYGDQ